MKLFYAKVGTQVVNINGTRVKFDNCIAEVEDAFGEEALALGLPGLYEDGTQPAFQTPREVALQASAADREEFLNKELGRLTNIKAALEQQLKEAQAEIEVWKSEYQKEHDLRIKEVGSKGAPQESVTAPAPTEEAQAELTEEEKLRAELELMTKAQILEFAKEAEIDMTPIANGKKPEMINFIMEQSKGE